jgi:hypothetical protein
MRFINLLIMGSRTADGSGLIPATSDLDHIVKVDESGRVAVRSIEREDVAEPELPHPVASDPVHLARCCMKVGVNSRFGGGG